jgi:hypothetical protein
VGLQAVQDDFERMRATFRVLLDGAADDELRRRSNGTRWTNRQLLFHMLLGFLIMRALLALTKFISRLPSWVGQGWAKRSQRGHETVRRHQLRRLLARREHDASKCDDRLVRPHHRGFASTS